MTYEITAINAIISLISYIVIGCISISSLALLLISVCVSFFLAKLIEKKKSKYILALGLLFQIGILVAVRVIPSVSILGLLGVSFYSLHIIGYYIDVFRGEVVAEENIVSYALYVSYLPTFFSGPIQRSAILLPQINSKRMFSYASAREGVMRVAFGLFEKVAVADRLVKLVDYAYNEYSVMSGATLAFGTVIYAFQLYFDFAGYSNIVIGISKVIGFDIGENFNRPYLSVSVKEFWQRWHISLSKWLRDYIYIPLGGNRNGKYRKYLNLFITFIVSGIWHGKGLNFLVWGCLHGIYQIGGDIFTRAKKVKICKAIKVILTFALVDFAWLFFRADSLHQAMVICKRILMCFQLRDTIMGGGFLMGMSIRYIAWTLISFAFAITIDALIEKKRDICAWISSRRVITRWLLYVGFALALILYGIQIYGNEASAFVYTNF